MVSNLPRGDEFKHCNKRKEDQAKADKQRKREKEEGVGERKNTFRKVRKLWKHTVPTQLNTVGSRLSE